MPLSSLAVHRPITTLMFYIGVVMLGLIAFSYLSVDFLPSIEIPRLSVLTKYPSASPEEMESAVTQAVESALGTVVGVKKVSSITREGVSIVTAECYWGTRMNDAMLDVREKLDQLRNALPREASRPTILRVDPAMEPIMTIALTATMRGRSNPVRETAMVDCFSRSASASSDRVSLVELKTVARTLVRRRIEQVDGVAQAAIRGGVEREIHVDVNTGNLRSLGFTLEQVSQALADANLSLPGGTIQQGLLRYPLRTLGEFTHIDEIRNTVVGLTPSGRPVRISDVGAVRDTFEERLGLIRYNGQEIIAVEVRKEPGANTVQVSGRIKKVLEDLHNEHPDLHLIVLSDHADFIKQAIDDVQQAIVIGAVLAFTVLFFFLGNVRYPLIVGVTMLVSLIATFVVMYLLGINLNVISLMGLALGIGMLGDNAIILIENVTRFREQGLNYLQAILRGSKEINIAVIASTLTNVAVFLPIVFVEGVASKLFLDMGVSMTVSLLVSLLVAVTLVPMLLSSERTRQAKPTSIQSNYAGSALEQRGVQKGVMGWATISVNCIVDSVRVRLKVIFSRVTSPIGLVGTGLSVCVVKASRWSYKTTDRYLIWALQHRLLVVIGTGGILLLSVGAAFIIPWEAAPGIDQQRFAIHVQMVEGTSLDGTEECVRYLEQKLLANSAVEGVFSSVGVTDQQNFWTAPAAAIEEGNLEVKVRNHATTEHVIEFARAIAGSLQRHIAGATVAIRGSGTTLDWILRSEENGVKIKIAGNDVRVLPHIAKQYGERIKGIAGVVDLRVASEQGRPEYRIDIGSEAISHFGLTVQAVADHIVQEARGRQVTVLRDFDRDVTVRVRPSSLRRRDVQDILSSSLLAGNVDLPVRNLVRCERTSGIAEIFRENHQRAVLIAANIRGRSIKSVADDLQREAARLALPLGHSISVGGAGEEIEESFRSLGIVILLSVLLVYMILAAEYESLLYPFVILLTSPLAFIGAVAAMVVAGQHFNVMSLVGMVIMIGAVDNDAVIAVDIMTVLRRKGLTPLVAIRRGVRQRLRPILMTTATTVLGVVPLVFSFGSGSELSRALTVPLVGGLLSSTLFSLLVIPVVYSYLDRWALGRTSSGRFFK